MRFVYLFAIFATRALSNVIAEPELLNATLLAPDSFLVAVNASF